MAAWKHSQTGWDDKAYSGYRKHAMSVAPSFRGRQEDCADLSMLLLINFAVSNGLPLTFEDNAGRRYISKAEGTLLRWGGGPYLLSDPTWSTSEDFRRIVRQRIGVAALWERNTVVNPHGPEPGDLMIIYRLGFTSGAGILGSMKLRHHTSLVYRVYKVAELHAKWNDKSIPNFPGSETAETQMNVTEYFKGTVNEDGATAFRTLDMDPHLDYLNHRGEAKPSAELIYYANARQVRDDGFQFRMYSKVVLDNWVDWNGQGTPPSR